MRSALLQRMARRSPTRRGVVDEESGEAGRGEVNPTDPATRRPAADHTARGDPLEGVASGMPDQTSACI